MIIIIVKLNEISYNKSEKWKEIYVFIKEKKKKERKKASAGRIAGNLAIASAAASHPSLSAIVSSIPQLPLEHCGQIFCSKVS